MRRSRAGDSWHKALSDKGLGYETVRSTVVKINLSTCLGGLAAPYVPRTDIHGRAPTPAPRRPTHRGKSRSVRRCGAGLGGGGRHGDLARLAVAISRCRP